MDDRILPLAHARFREVEAAIFMRRLVADCMSHGCSMLATHEPRLDACCQYGCDVDLEERDAIQARAAEIRAMLRPEVRDVPWFEAEEYKCDEYPSGKVVRTELFEGGCIFLAHDLRGCAIHRAALERGFDLRGVKPAMCRLFPLSWEGDRLVVAEEYPEFSCSREQGPTLYRLTRTVLGELFGAELVRALDEVEARAGAR